jgi:hypothetical protein
VGTRDPYLLSRLGKLENAARLRKERALRLQARAQVRLEQTRRLIDATKRLLQEVKKNSEVAP